jgi:hypothetical protein
MFGLAYVKRLSVIANRGPIRAIIKSGVQFTLSPTTLIARHSHKPWVCDDSLLTSRSMRLIYWMCILGKFLLIYISPA